MSDLVDTLKAVVFFLLAIIVGFVAWFGKRNADRLDELKETAVTRDELTERLNRIEQRQREQHSENRDVLERIESKIDANEERASKTRHDTLNEVHAVAMKVATLQGRETR